MEPTKVVGRRVAAIVIDYLLLLAFNTAVFFAMAQKDSEIAREVLSGETDPDATSYGNLTLGDSEYSIVGGDFLIYLLITVGVGVLYWMVLPGLKGWTLGKLALGLRVVREDGSCPAGVGRNVIRQLLWIVDDFPYFIPALTGFVVALASDRNRRVGDMVAGTLVVRDGAVGQQFSAGGQAPAAAAAGPQSSAPAEGVAAQTAARADWYADPHGQKRLRYWDGARWTEHTAD